MGVHDVSGLHGHMDVGRCNVGGELQEVKKGCTLHSTLRQQFHLGGGKVWISPNGERRIELPHGSGSRGQNLDFNASPMEPEAEVLDEPAVVVAHETRVGWSQRQDLQFGSST